MNKTKTSCNIMTLKKNTEGEISKNYNKKLTKLTKQNKHGDQILSGVKTTMTSTAELETKQQVILPLQHEWDYVFM